MNWDSKQLDAPRCDEADDDETKGQLLTTERIPAETNPAGKGGESLTKEDNPAEKSLACKGARGKGTLEVSGPLSPLLEEESAGHGLMPLRTLGPK